MQALTACSRRTFASKPKKLVACIIRKCSTNATHRAGPQTMPIYPEDRLKLLNKEASAGENAFLLKTCIVGAPNAGKSTLLNQLLGWKVAPVSSKVHTTRKQTIGVFTEGERQIVFLDTPGVIRPNSVKKHRLELSLLTDPHSSLLEAELIVVDVSKIWYRSRLDPEILKLLYIHHNKPSILVLNKIDTLRRKPLLLDVTRTLTAGQVGGVPVSTLSRPAHRQDRITAERVREMYRRMDAQHGEPSTNTEPAQALTPKNAVDQGPQSIVQRIQQEVAELKLKPDNIVKPEVWQDYYNRRLARLDRALEGQSGWPHFSEVFMVSALQNDGVDGLRRHLLSRARPADWLYSEELVTTETPRRLAQHCVREKLLDALPHVLPYNITLKTHVWEVDRDQMLRIVFHLHCKNGQTVGYLLKARAETLIEVARQAKQELMNAFKRDLTLKLIVVTDQCLKGPLPVEKLPVHGAEPPLYDMFYMAMTS